MKEILITSSVLIAALVLLRLVFSRKVSRTLIYGAWILVALRLLIPVQIGQLNFSVLTAARPLTETVEAVSGLRVIGQNEREADIQVTKDYIEQDRTVFNPEVQEYIQSALDRNRTPEEIATDISKTQSREDTFVPEVREQVARQVEEQTDFVSLGQVAKIVWLSGAGVMVLWFGFVNLRHSRMLRKHGEKLECESPIPVYVSQAIGSPCLVGLFRPAVYLTPESAASEETLRHVLAHELTHYRHGDHIWALVRCVCLCVYWFDPLVWAAAYLSRRDCELACDERAVKILGEAERLAYGKTLLKVVSHASAPAHLMQTATSMNETKKQLKERVNFIVRKPKISITAAICMVLVCTVIAGCAAAGPNAQTPGTQPSPNVPTTTPTTAPTTVPTTVPQEPTLQLTRSMKLTKWGENKLYCSYTVDRDICYPNDWVTVVAEIINLGKSIHFDGELVAQLGVNAWLSADHADYSIESYGFKVDGDTADNAFETGTMLRVEYHFQIPEDIVAGHYSLVISVFGVQVRFDEKTVVEDLENQANNDLAELIQQLVVNEELATFQTLFGQMNTWYNSALISQYASPKEIKLYQLFYNGFAEESREPTDEEWEELKDEPGFTIEYDLLRLPADRMNQVLTDLFGITLEDVEPAGFENLVYLESTDCYYMMHTDAWFLSDFNAIGLQYMEDGTICVAYTARGGDILYMLTVMPYGDGYRILSNVRR